MATQAAVIATPEASPTATVGSSLASDDQQSLKALNQLDDRMKNIDRSKLGPAEAQRYDIASGLLASAHKAALKGDSLATASLIQKAKVLVEGIAP